MDKELPKIDFPELWLVGADINADLLNLYAHYPVRLKCEIIALCMGGSVDITINLNKLTVRENDIIVLLPGSVFQFEKIEGNLKIYFFGFSFKYISQKSNSKIFLEVMCNSFANPKLSMCTSAAQILEKQFRLYADAYAFITENKIQNDIADNLFNDIHTTLQLLHRSNQSKSVSVSKSEQLCMSYTQLVMKNYQTHRNVAWYAEKLNISHAHLCAVVKQATGRTCADVIASMVIMDAKSQIKSTDIPIQEISDSLNFANMSFFGKYFKRHTGMSPMEYRKNE